MRTAFPSIAPLAGSLLLAATPAWAGNAQGAASKLSLAAAAASQGQGNCVTRAGQPGKWQVDAAGNWVACNQGTGKGGAPGQTWLIVGAVGAVGLGLGLGLSHNHSQPTSP